MPLYQTLTKENLVIVGDSAGGGLAAGFTLYLKEKGLVLPEQIILISPWVDVTLSNPAIYQYKELDPLLPIDFLKVAGTAWAGSNTDRKNPLVSPLFGDLTHFSKQLFLLELTKCFIRKIIDFHQQLLVNTVDSQLIVAEKMLHTYPVFPVKEGKEAIQQIVNYVNSK